MKKKGFTLIELIAAIAILSILAIIVAPNVLGKFNESRIKAMIIQEGKLVESGSILVQDHCKNPVDEDYKNRCNNVYADVSSIEIVNAENNEGTNNLNDLISDATGTSNIIRKYICVKDMKTLGYYSEKLKYGGDDCVGFVIYQIDEFTGREVSSYSHIKCGVESYISGDNEIADALKSSKGGDVSYGIEELFERCSVGNIGPNGEINPETNKFKLTVNYIDYDSNSTFDSKSYTYDGNPISLTIEKSGWNFLGYFTTDIHGYTSFASQVQNLTKDSYINLYYSKEYEDDVNYKINYWKQKVDAKGDEHNEDNFEKVKDLESLELSAKPNIDIEVPLQSFEGFITPDNHVKIKPDGSSVFDFYYLRETYEVSIVSNELGTVDNNKFSVKYETNFSSENNKLIFGDNQVIVTATPKTIDGVENKFGHWNPSSGAVLNDTKIDVVFNLPNQYTVNYDCNGGTGKMSSSSFIANKKESLPANTCVFTGYSFDSWNTRADGKGTKYENGDTVNSLCTSENCTVTLYAQWDEYQYNIEFDGGNCPTTLSGSTNDLKNIKYTAVKSLSNGFACSNHVFSGWLGSDGKIYSNNEEVSGKTFNVANSSTIRMTAQWADGGGFLEDFNDGNANNNGFTITNSSFSILDNRYYRTGSSNNSNASYSSGGGNSSSFFSNMFSSGALSPYEFTATFKPEHNGIFKFDYNMGDAGFGWNMNATLSDQSGNSRQVAALSICNDMAKGMSGISNICIEMDGGVLPSSPRSGTAQINISGGVTYTFKFKVAGYPGYGGNPYVDNLEVIYN